MRTRQATVDSFLWDDGWDDQGQSGGQELWNFHDGLPQGFEAVGEEAAKIGSGIGVWLSPWGGYGSSKDHRLAKAVGMGYETNRMGLSLAGHHYYARFRDIALEMVRRYNVNMFKFDGVAGDPSEVARDVMCGPPTASTPGKSCPPHAARAIRTRHPLL